MKSYTNLLQSATEASGYLLEDKDFIKLYEETNGEIFESYELLLKVCVCV